MVMVYQQVLVMVIQDQMHFQYSYRDYHFVVFWVASLRPNYYHAVMSWSETQGMVVGESDSNEIASINTRNE
jgi:hypothetical protein